MLFCLEERGAWTKSERCSVLSVVPGGRIELPTPGFSIQCSTTELPRPVFEGSL